MITTAAEETLIGMAINGHMPDLLAKGVGESLFTGPNLDLWRLLTSRFTIQQPIDLLALSQSLFDIGRAELIPVVTDLSRQAPGAGMEDYYIEQCRNAHFRRQVLAGATALVSACTQEYDDEELRKMAGKLAGVILAPAKTKDRSMQELCLSVVSELDKRLSGGETGHDTGLVDLDEQIGCMLPKELVIICGAAKAGKTALMVGILVHLVRKGIGCGLLSLEMSGIEVASRLIASEGRVDLLKFRNPSKMTTRDHTGIHRGSEAVRDFPLHIREDIHDLSEMLGMIRVWAAQGVKVVAVDYIQLASGIRGHGDSREMEVASISRSLKRIAVELGILIIAGSQLNDNGKLRESRAIGQDANMVLSVEKVFTEKGHLIENERDISIVASRSGPGDKSIRVTYLSQYTKFENHARG